MQVRQTRGQETQTGKIQKGVNPRDTDRNMEMAQELRTKKQHRQTDTDRETQGLNRQD